MEERDLPHIAVIDSRTGAKIVTMKGQILREKWAMCIYLCICMFFYVHSFSACEIF